MRRTDPDTRTRRFTGIAAAMLTLIAAAGCSARAPQAPQAPGTGPDIAAEAATPRPGTYYTAADVHFMSMMIGHHAQAIEMSRMAPSHTDSPEIRTLAARIINGQQDEITIMQRWLRDRGQPVPDAHAPTMKHTAAGGEHEMSMPGMLSEAQMKELEAARGAEFDRLFLTFMIEHHKGAVTMVNDVFAAGAAQDNTVFRLASDINAEQTTEIARMQRMLFDRVIGKTP